MTSPEASTDAASSSAKNGLPAAERAMASRVPRRQRPAGRALGHGCERAAIERTERQLHRGPAPEQPRSHERRRLGEWLIAHRGDHEHALAGAAAREMVHERRRCLVGVVQVIDRQHHAAFRGGLSQQLGDRAEHHRRSTSSSSRPSGRRTDGSSRESASCARSESAPINSGRRAASGSSASVSGA